MRKFLLLVFYLFFSIANAQDHDFDSLFEHSKEFQESVKDWQQNYNLFDETDPLELTLKSDFRNLVKKKFKDEYQAAVIEIKFNDTISIVREIKIKPRGNFRRKNCFYPPIRLNFQKTKVFLQHLSEFDKLNLVQLCKRGETFENYLLSEYYAYGIYNIITPFSFRVRLLKINYIDTSGKSKPRTNFAFIIENEKQMAARLNATPIKTENVHSEKTNRQLSSILYMFQYLIGNTDFSIRALHNIKLIKVNNIDMFEPVAIPYDFDYSGIVNAYYAIPREEIPIKTVSERFYLGFCRGEHELKQIFNIFKNKKPEIYNLILQSEFLNKKEIKRITSYLDAFYQQIENEDIALRYFNDRCRQR